MIIQPYQGSQYVGRLEGLFQDRQEAGTNDWRFGSLCSLQGIRSCVYII